MIDLLESLLRAICRRYGHRTTENTRGAPVVGPFKVCLRCGKWER